MCATARGALARARVAADVAADAYGYLNRLFSEEPDIAVIVASKADWKSRQPYGLPFFNDDPGQIRPGIVVMPAGSGDFWVAMGQDLRDRRRTGMPGFLPPTPAGKDGPNLQPFFDLITIHELGHAFEVLGDLRLPAFWLGEIFADLASTRSWPRGGRKACPCLKHSPTWGHEPRLAARWRAEGYTTLEELEAHYTGGDQPMTALNYVWYQYRWQRLAAKMFDADGEGVLIRLWDCFHSAEPLSPDQVTTRNPWPDC